MTSPADDDLRARLRAADPAADLPAADPTETDRLLQRVVDADLRETGTRRRSPLTWLVAAAAAVIIAVGAVLWLTQTGDDGTDGGLLADPGRSSSPADTGTSALTVGAAGAGRCIMPTPELLAGEPIAFSGTVEGVTDGVVTIRTADVFAGDVADEVTVKGAVAPDTGGAPEGDPEFVPGQDYLVAAADGRVIGCGMSGPVTPELQRLYQQAFPR